MNKTEDRCAARQKIGVPQALFLFQSAVVCLNVCCRLPDNK